MIKNTKQPAYDAPYALVLKIEMEQKVIMASGDLDDEDENNVHDEGF